ncbi:MAG TPA: hypothetical protein VG651_10445 [Stellaceae bacterium]|nr:hypothetical protein [Stellaceae bacterium]
MDFTEFKRCINAITVSPELLGEAMMMIANLPAADKASFDARTAHVVALVERQGWGEASCLVAMAVAVRLMALDSVLDDRVVKAWQLPSAAGCGGSYVHRDVLRAAAEEPVLEGPDGEPVFAIAAFCTRLAATAAPKGRA